MAPAMRISLYRLRRPCRTGNPLNPCTASSRPPTPSQTGLQPHHRRGVRISGSQRGWEDCETTDLGHGWPGAFSVGGLGSHGERVGGRGRREGRIWGRERCVESLGDNNRSKEALRG